MLLQQLKQQAAQ